jgi:hypothetical protein
MPTIKIISARQPWAAGLPQPMGAEVEVSDEDAAVLVANGFAEITSAAAKPAARRRRTEDEAAS